MPVHKVSGGYKWGKSGKTYPTKAGAQKQAAAIYANGYREEQFPAPNTQVNGQVTPPVREKPQNLGEQQIFPAPGAVPA